MKAYCLLFLKKQNRVAYNIPFYYTKTRLYIYETAVEIIWHFALDSVC